MAKNKEEVKFVILAHARSGSTWLRDAIDHIDGVTCFGELFNPRVEFVKYGEDKEMETFNTYRKNNSGIRPFITFKYLEEIFAKNRTLGFKLLVSQQKRSLDVFLYLVIKRIAIIHLVRDNTLDLLVSKKSAWHRGKFNYRRGQELPPETAWEHPVDDLLSQLEWTERRTRQIRALLRLVRLPHIEVRYENLAKGPEEFRPVWRFLGVDFEDNPPFSEMQKVRKKSLPELITNYAEVEQALANTKFARHLYKNEPIQNIGGPEKDGF